MNRIGTYFDLFIKYYKMNLMSFWQYQVDFMAWILASFAEMVVSIVNIGIIFSNVNSIGGWGFYEILFLTSLVYLVRCFWHTFMINMLDISFYIRSGRLDYYIVKPINTLFQLIASGRYNTEFDWEDFVGGLALLIVSSINLGMVWSIGKLCSLVIVILGGALIYSSLILIASTTAFWTVKSFAAVELLKTGEQLAVYPISFYSKPIQYILTYVLPFAFISYFPSLYFINNTHFNHIFLNVIIGLGLSCAGYGFWNYGLSKYQSTGG